MIDFKTFEVCPSNSPKNVTEIIDANFNRIIGEKMPDLLSKFITLLGNEKEEWGGVAAMKACMNEFFKEYPKLKDKVSTVKDLEEFLFSPNRYVPIFDQGTDSPSTSMAVIQGVVDPPASSKTVKGPDRPSTSKATTPNMIGPPANPKTLKGPDRPSTSTAVNPHVVNKTSAANPKTLKVKIYMGSGWDIVDFPNLRPPSSLKVKLKINDGESHKTKREEKTAIPCWEEEFVFPLSSPKDAKLIVEVYDRRRIIIKEFAGKICLSVPELELKQGIHTIVLSNQAGNPCSSARLVVRIMFD